MPARGPNWQVPVGADNVAKDIDDLGRNIDGVRYWAVM